ncbi:UBP-type zinc finger domain-containing protein [Kitasatospora viridis]|uniref:Ubiquitin-hydrolase Zn-finger-containing protein n=1 Tax=Kitasatospora viridis TaxID=281105 RepID=A0A561T7E3_9ACTN|nr:UBP-type zinc finger domain-containing protein [Kitasatospora viridis]TWF83033.1 ubiquitin-hydrolase Zn-finger-containing protein [Kitasatospora viridis]
MAAWRVAPNPDQPDASCPHLGEAHPGVLPATRQGCVDCLAAGTSWVHLRMCLSCGHIGCCDSSPERHATAHFGRLGHSLIRSFEPGETWGWCYRCELMLEPDPS